MIKLKSVSKEYPIDGEIFKALDDISLEVKKGEYSSILGPSGSGKSTLMHIMGLLDNPSSGKVIVNNKDISTLDDDSLSTLRNEFVGFVFQQFNLINKLTILENIMLPALYARKKLKFDPKKKALDLINHFGISGKENTYPNKLSGGQQQRVAISRALIMDPELVLADEPTGNLDTKNGNSIMDLLEDLNKKQQVTVVVITHEKDIADRTKKKIQILDGKISK
ncbi:ABC transporter ATP-binding protein [Patescibacteria group bacterium]